VKKLITISTVAALMVLTTSVVYALPISDNFNDNSQDTSLWNLYEDNHTNAWLDEINDRLELRSAGSEDGAAGYFANGWGFSPTTDFSFKIDFHFFSPSSGPADTDAAVQLCLNTDLGSDILIEAGCGSTGGGTAYHSFFYSAIENIINNSEIPKGEKQRDTDNGTLYISYDASEDVLYLSDTGYWATNAWVAISDLLQGEWDNNVVIPSFGGWSDGVILNSNDAYLDNFVIDSGTIVSVPEPATICLLALGSLALIRNKK